MPEDRLSMRRELTFTLLVLASFISFNKLPFNIVYIMSAPVVFLSFYWYRSMKKGAIFIIAYIFLFTAGLFIGLHEFSEVYGINNTTYLSSILFLYCILLGVQVYVVGAGLNKWKRVKVYRFIFDFFIIYMLIDLVCRVFILRSDAGNFYDYKKSFFYFDSNFSGMVISVFTMFGLYLKRKKLLDIGLLKFTILIALLLLSFSRAAILATLLTYFMVSIPKKIRTFSLVTLGVIAMYVLVAMLKEYFLGGSFVSIDGSFNSKFYIMAMAVDNYSNLSTLNKIFGIGFNNYQSLHDIFAHNIIVTLAYELGWYGTLLFLTFNLFYWKKIKNQALYIYIPVLIGGFSLFSAYMPFYFALLSCVYIEEQKN